MRRAFAAIAGVTCLGGALMLTGADRGEARDFGRLGQTFPVVEPDLLATIEARLQRAQATGELARVNAAFAKRAEAKVRRPDPVQDIMPAERTRSWTFDPTTSIDREIRDHKGQLIAAAGQRINPLDFVSMRQDLVFVDGDDPAQLDWATRRYPDLKAKIILTGGAPLEAMTQRKRRFYFDQQGRLTSKFGIRHVPAVVTQAGKVLRITETALAKGRAG